MPAGIVVAPPQVQAQARAQAQVQAEPPDEELPPVECPEFDGAPAAEDEFTAYRYALACGVNVEVLGLRDVDRQVFATPAGVLDAQIAVEPYRVRNDAGEWVGIDPTFAVRPDGSAASTATVIDIVVGAGGGDTFVTAVDPDGGSLSLKWPGGVLPTPVLNGPVATYPELLPGVDLAVQAESVGFSWVLVVKTAEAAASPALAEIVIGVDTVGLNVVEDAETGRIDVVDDTGAVIFEAGQGIMWDSSVAGGDGSAAATAPRTAVAGEPPADPGRIGDVEVEVTAPGIELIPDPEMLADETVTYPIYIDPPFTSTRKAWANVYAGARGRGWTGDSSWPRAGGMRVGYNTWSNCGNGCGLWRSVIKLDIGKLNGRYIASASVKALQTHTGGCGSYGLQLWRTEAISNGVSWNGVTWLYGSQLQTESVPSSNTTGGCGSDNSHEWVSFDGANVKRRVQSAADQRYDTISFGLRSSSEDDRNAWRRIRTSSVALHVTYYIYPPQPDMRKLNGEPCRTSLSRAQWVTSRHPTMSVRARSYESESVYVRLRIRERGADSNYFWYRTPDPVGSHATVNRRVTTSLPDGEYTWQARADARQTSAVNSGYTDPCHFKVDATKPSVPTVTAPEGPYTEGQNVRLGVSASDPIVNGVHSGLNRYEYSWNTPTFDRSVPPTGSTTITRADAEPGRHVLYVRSVDNAGNTSNERTYTFFVGRDIPATAMGAWRLGGDLVDDSGNGAALTMSTGTGPAFGPDRGDPDNVLLNLDGSTCLTTTPTVRTDAAFSVSLNVRLDAASGYAKLLTQGNENHSAYQIQHNATTNMWSFSLLTSPGTDAEWRSVSAVSPVARGQWLRIAGTYDPDAGVQRLFFDGALVAEQSVDFEPWNGMDTFGLGCLRGASGSHGHFFTGAVDNVAVWQGLLSSYALRLNDPLPLGEIARWEMRHDGTDSSGFGRDLLLPDSAAHDFDPFHRPDGALVLDGQSCAATQAPVAPSDTAFGISAWVKPVRVTGGYQVLFSQLDTDGDGFVVVVDKDGLLQAGPPAAFGLPGAGGTASGSAGQAPARLVPPGQDVKVREGWQRISVQYGGGASWQVVIDGTSSGTRSEGDPGAAGAPLLVGCADYGQGHQHHFQGMLHDVRVWRGDRTFNLDDPWPAPPSELQGRWRLMGHGSDTSGHGRDVRFEGDTRFNDGWSCDPDSALELTGAGQAATAGPVVATDDSFTVSAWVRIDRLDADLTIVSAAGQQATAFRLRYSQSLQKFGFVMMSGDVASPSWLTAYGGPTPEPDTWYHLAGVYDLHSDAMRLYVSGEQVASRSGPESPWNASGPLLLGAAGTADGGRGQRLHGAVDDVVVWQGRVPDHIIGQISAAPVPKC
ncbi:LamG-like jellyroll fold domain-containing protein [Plantactinospora sp. B6F1]|uniref:LamG-like jellyroll fold domain-containing protein n=1 Tax=Plantactinospora sp. B6F1 TaxID=3158971 RepID=UPI0032D90643